MELLRNYLGLHARATLALRPLEGRFTQSTSGGYQGGPFAQSRAAQWPAASIRHPLQGSTRSTQGETALRRVETPRRGCSLLPYDLPHLLAVWLQGLENPTHVVGGPPAAGRAAARLKLPQSHSSIGFLCPFTHSSLCPCPTLVLSV